MDDVLRVIDRSNQRGERMLSMVDLILADTLSVGQAAWLMERVAAGSSWLVGAKPGGAGKTTVVGALLGVLSPDVRVLLTNAGTGWQDAVAGDCVVSYEIGSGSYDAYIWGRDVAHFTRLGAEGVRIVANLHADTLEQARAQIVDENGATSATFAAFDLFIPIRMTGLTWPRRRVVDHVQWHHDGAWRSIDRRDAERLADASVIAFLDRCVRAGMRHLDAVRSGWVSMRYAT